MRMPPENISSERLFESYGIYHLAKISSDPETVDLEAALKAVQDALFDAFNKRKECRRAVIIATAKRDQADMILDSCIRKLYLELLAELNNKKESEIYKKLFPKHLTGIVNISIADEIKNVKQTLEPELQNQSTKNDFFKKHLELIKNARINIEQAVKTLDESLLAEGTAWAKEKAAQIDWRRQYEKNYGELRSRFAGDKWRAESYFKIISFKNSEEEETEQSQNSAQ